MAEKRSPVKVPVILQLEALECGAASLTMVLAYYKKWVPLEEVRVECGVSSSGSNALNIVKAARRYGLESKGYRYGIKSLQEKCTFPAIVFWNVNHYIVLNGFKGGYAYVNDPARGFLRMPYDEFKKGYSGVCLTFAKGEDFEPGGEKPGTFGFVKKALKGNKRTMGLVMTTGALAVFAGILIPVFSRVYTDDILSGNVPGWYRGFLWLFFGVVMFQLAAGIINAVYVKRATGKLAVASNASFIHHIFRMPMEFFSQRMAGELAGRATSNDTVAATLIGRMAPVLINLLLVLFYLVVMLRYSVPLTIVGLCTVGINLILAKIISKKRLEISRVQIRDQGNLNAATMSGIDMIETIKAAGAEKGYIERWSGFHANVVKSRVRFDGVNRYLGTLPVFLQDISNITVMLLAFLSIINGHFSAGMFLAFQTCMTAFISPVNQLIESGQSIQEMRSSIERIHDVMEYPEDVMANEDYDPEELSDAKKLSGHIEIKNVTFGYAKLGDPVIEDFSLTVEPGQRVALVGGSGCGKSTVAKLLTGLYKPWSGEILFDGKPISEITKPVFNGSVAMVDQEVVLFQDTIADNIRMWDKTIEDYECVMAARDADIHKDIMSRKGGYDHVLENNGQDLSGGQRQRIEIARALAGDPSVIIMDEATSALDARTEYEISEHIVNRGITSIIIAHRLSTIRDCDKIIVMDRGKIVQQGNHKELIKEDGLYRKLVTTQ